MLFKIHKINLNPEFKFHSYNYDKTGVYLVNEKEILLVNRQSETVIYVCEYLTIMNFSVLIDEPQQSKQEEIITNKENKEYNLIQGEFILKLLESLKGLK
jgi:hypothetical protein